MVASRTQVDLAASAPLAGRVLLISAPWRLAHWPSLAIAALKASLAVEHVACTAVHLHLRVAAGVGLERYAAIADGWELGEALYGALLVPEEAGTLISRQVQRLGNTDLAAWVEGSALEELARSTDEAVDALDLSDVAILGCSVGAMQLMASLYVARRIRQRAPNIQVVFGGSALIGDVGSRLLRSCRDVDVVVDGEGEDALVALARLARPWIAETLASVPGAWHRDADQIRCTGRIATRVLDSQATPDLSEYFEMLEKVGMPRSSAVLPLEVSRGCAWEHRRGDGALHGCTFCGLYRSSPNYRVSPISRVLASIDEQIERTRVLDLAFVDAYLHPEWRRELLEGLASVERDTTLFCELRCDLDEETANLLARAGARRVQLGVEAFSSAILRRLAKGTRLIDNVATMRLCAEYGIPYQYNVLVEIPGVPCAEIDEMTGTLPLLFGLDPPHIATFYLDRGSRMFAEAERHGIRAASLDAEPLPYMPTRYADPHLSLGLSYRLSDPDALAAWQRFAIRVQDWQRAHEDRHVRLVYRDAGRYLLVEDHRDSAPRVATLEGRQRALFLACTRPQTRAALQKQLGVSTSGIEIWIESMRELGWLLEDGGRLLTLPTRQRRPDGRARASSPPSPTSRDEQTLVQLRVGT